VNSIEWKGLKVIKVIIGGLSLSQIPQFLKRFPK